MAKVTVGHRDLERRVRREKRAAAKAAVEDAVKPVRAKRPRFRSECKDGPRPCPWVGCRYHLFLEVNRFGSLTFPHGEDPDVLPTMVASCALDMADKGGMDFKMMGHLVNLSEYGTRLVANRALAALAARKKLEELSPDGKVAVWHKAQQGVRRHPQMRPDLDCFLTGDLS